MITKYRKLSSMYYESKEKYEETYNNRYNFETTYKLDFDIHDNKTFIVLCNEILELCAESHEMDKRLLNVISKLPKEAIHKYKNNCLVDEIKVTNEIEGIHSTRKEIVDILEESKHRDKQDTRFVGLVKRYDRLMSRKIDNEVKELINCTDIRNLYDEIVLQEVISSDKDDAADGSIFRKGTVQVLDVYGKSIHKGVHPEEKLIVEMTKALNFMNDERYNSLIRTSAFHYMFCYLHPFYNGNGRMARFISSITLTNDFNELISYRLAHTIKKDKNAYYKLFEVTNDDNNKGDLTHFVIGFMQIIKSSIYDLCETLEEKYIQYNHYVKIADLIKKKNKRGGDIIKELILNELFAMADDNGKVGASIKELTDKLEISETIVRKNIGVYNNIVQKFTSGREYKYSIDLNALEQYADMIKEEI